MKKGVHAHMIQSFFFYLGEKKQMDRYGPARRRACPGLFVKKTAFNFKHYDNNIKNHVFNKTT